MLSADDRSVIRVVVPASTANLGPGFDTLGMALPLYMNVDLGWAQAGKSYPAFNTGLVGSIIRQVMQEVKIDRPFICQVNSEIPMARGLGSSAAAVVGALLAVNELLDQRWSREDILKRSVSIEGHADNVVPALVGGFTTAMVTEAGVFYQQLKPPTSLKLLIAVPDKELATRGARQVLPNEIPLTDAVFNLQRACYMVAAFASDNIQGLKAVFHDRWHQPFRENMVPGLRELTTELENRPEVLGVTLSGSGPSMLVLMTDNQQEVQEVMENTLAIVGWKGDIYAMLPALMGATIERRSNRQWGL